MNRSPAKRLSLGNYVLDCPNRQAYPNAESHFTLGVKWEMED